VNKISLQSGQFKSKSHTQSVTPVEALEQTILGYVVTKTKYFNNTMRVGKNIFPLGQSQSHFTGKNSHTQSINIISALQAHDNFQVSQCTESTRNAQTDPHGRFMSGYSDFPDNLLIHD
jgi:hypothetical protein